MAGVLAYFTPDASSSASFGNVSSRVVLPGTPASDTLVMVTNYGSVPVTVRLGSNTVTVTPTTGLLILAGQSVAIGLGSATYIAGIVTGAPAQYGLVNLTTGS